MKRIHFMSLASSITLGLTILMLSCGLSLTVPAQGPWVSRNERPRLVVMISVDQLGTHVFEEAAGYFPSDASSGFTTLASLGTWFRNCSFGHATTFTGPGHATIGTGAHPREHGVVGNAWHDVTTNKSIYCCEDASAGGVGSSTATGQRGPLLLKSPTLGGTMKVHFGKHSRVVSLSWKDRAAVLMAGRGADVAAWMDKKSGVFITSTAYGKSLPEWLTILNDSRPCDRFFGRKWELLRSPQSGAYNGLLDNRKFERPAPGKGNTFPHVFNGGLEAPGPAFYEHLYGSPFANDILVQAAGAAIAGEQLGADATPDLLCVSFSANDVVGHRFGPRSFEVRDLTLRTDLQIGQLLKTLDQQVGLEHCAVILTADHGVAPAPEPLVANRLSAGRGKVRLEVAKACNRALVKFLGPAPKKLKRWVAGYDAFSIFLFEDAIPADKRTRALELAAEEARTAKGAGLVVTAHSLRNGTSKLSPQLASLLVNSLHEPRTGPIIFAPSPHWTATTSIAATHGSPWGYDRDVPLFYLAPKALRGKFIRTGRQSASVTPALGVTLLAEALGIPAPAHALEKVPVAVRP